ncbi:hypothetical protein [Amycolatopsis sp. Hca4]|uniref:hypothetical protein n=1 Tax=Amycolatopsis sp. Hca4 TaxID=2742131 RepID=UPI0015925F92|nr:hypothetical protein [Amycolatopsis sp. Hca4]QKV73966.1 hypothetical protein HUT10_09435 [Amycolatopsis sp. Hca4]
MLGLLSAATAVSWWVPYEIGLSRSAHVPVSYLVVPPIRSMAGLPESVRLGANFWSADEWCGGPATARVVAVIELLATPGAWTTLKLTRTGGLQWLPSAGGTVRDLVYDPLAPLAFADVAVGTVSVPEEGLRQSAAAVVTWRRILAQVAPALPYEPEVEGWRYERYRNPPVHGCRV